jgi:phosphatidylglycerophosphate synthase
MRPQQKTKESAANDAGPETAPERAQMSALCFIGDSDIRLWALTPIERLRRQFAREGVTAEISIAEASRRQGTVIFIRGDAVLDQPLIPILVKRPDLVIIGTNGGDSVPLAVQAEGRQANAVIDILATGHAPSAELRFEARRPDELEAKFWKALRKRETPYAFRLAAANRPDVEWRMFVGTYKGATDLITKHLWPRPAFLATRWLAPRGVTPNMVTLLAAVLVLLTFWLFLQGHFGLGLATAWFMTFLDTVDGKLARTTLTSSKWGDVFDHGLDLMHPPFWYVAWGLGLTKTGHALDDSTLWIVIAAIVGGYVLQRMMEGVAIKWLGLEIHIWRKIDTLFREITARRNPNLLILTFCTLAGRPDWGLLAVAWWTVICLVLHGLQLGQALVAGRAGPLESWMARS